MRLRGTRQTLHAKGRQGTAVTIVVEVYRRKVWLTVIDVPFVAEGILEPGQADSIGDLLVQAASEARGKQTAKPAARQKRSEEEEGKAAVRERAEGQDGSTTAEP